MLHVRSCLVVGAILILVAAAAPPSFAYPPGVGIAGKSRSCLACHASNGPWADDARTVVDVLDGATKTSLRLPDGSYRIEATRGRPRTVITVLGRRKGDPTPPRRNAWLYVDPSQIETTALSKFAPGWEVNLPLSCRIVGDKLAGYEGDALTVLPMTVRPTDTARDAELELQALLTAGESVKGAAKEGLLATYLLRKVLLKVMEP